MKPKITILQKLSPFGALKSMGVPMEKPAIVLSERWDTMLAVLDKQLSEGSDRLDLHKILIAYTAMVGSLADSYGALLSNTEYAALINQEEFISAVKAYKLIAETIISPSVAFLEKQHEYRQSPDCIENMLGISNIIKEEKEEKPTPTSHII